MSKHEEQTIPHGEGTVLRTIWETCNTVIRNGVEEKYLKPAPLRVIMHVACAGVARDASPVTIALCVEDWMGAHGYIKDRDINKIRTAQ